MKRLCLLWLAAVAVWALGLSIAAAREPGGTLPQRLAIMQCCGCFEHLDAQTKCDKFDCPECPVRYQLRTFG
jgi:hypothetical protein